MSDYIFDYTEYSTAGSEWIPTDGSPKSALQILPPTWAFDDGIQSFSQPAQSWTEAFTVPGNIDEMDIPDISDNCRLHQQEAMYAATLNTAYPASVSESQWAPRSSLVYRSEQHAVPLNNTGISISPWSFNGFDGIPSLVATGDSSSMTSAPSPQSWAQTSSIRVSYNQ